MLMDENRVTECLASRHAATVGALNRENAALRREIVDLQQALNIAKMALVNPEMARRICLGGRTLGYPTPEIEDILDRIIT